MKRLVQTFRAFIRALFPSSPALNVGGADAESQRLQDLAAEQGARAGALNLPPAESFNPVAAAARLSAENSYGQPGPKDEALNERERYWQEKRLEVEAKIKAHQSHPPVKPEPQNPPTPLAPVNWLKAIGNVVALCALVAVCLQAKGFEPGLGGCVALASCAIFVLLNWASWPSWLRSLLARIGYGLAALGHRMTDRRLRAELKRIDLNLADTQRQREAEAIRRSQVETRLAQLMPLARACFDDHYARGRRASQLLAEKQRAAKIALEPALLAFEHNGLHDARAAAEEPTLAAAQSQQHWKGV